MARRSHPNLMINVPQEQIRAIAARYQPLLKKYDTLTKRGWKFFVTAYETGVCNLDRKWVLIPDFILGDSDYSVYILAHECAHTEKDAQAHGAVFMRHFRELCPEHLQYHELSYKPRNAKAAGIQRKPLDIVPEIT